MDMNIEQFLDLASNADKYAAKLKELRAYEDSIKQAGAKLGDMQRAAAMKAEAEKVLADAKVKAEEITAEAKKAEAVRKEIIDNEFKELQAQRRTAGDIRQQGLDAKVRAETLLKEVEVKERNLAKDKALLEAHKEEVANLKAEYEQRLAKLKSVMQ